MKSERIGTASTDRAFSERDCSLDAGEMPAAGSHVIAIRSGYAHHGIYVGNGRVVHYAGWSRRWAGGPVEEVSFERFADGRAVFVRPHLLPRFDRPEVVGRARSRIGEASYRLLTNNCEHFCEWCIRGEPRSQQVEALTRAPRRMLRLLCARVACRVNRWLPPQPPRGGWAV